MEDAYLTPDELSKILKFKKQSIYNLIHKKVFILGIHYYKPSYKKILFKLSAVQKWIEGNGNISVNSQFDNNANISIIDDDYEFKFVKNETIKNLINI